MATEARLDVLLTADQAGRITTCIATQDEVLGWSAAELVGQNVSVLVPGLDGAHHDRYMANYLRTGETKVLGRPRTVEAQHRAGALDGDALIAQADAALYTAKASGRDRVEVVPAP